MPPTAAKQVREKTNWLIHMLYIRQDYDQCLEKIEEALKGCNGMAEYPIYVKALIKRQRGEINESLQLFQAATCLNPHNICNLKQVGRSLYLLGKHKAALDVYEEAQRIGIDDWEIWHNQGLCYMYLKQFDRALYFFEICVTCPTAAVSHIMLEAFKKYQLVGLLVHGDKPKAFKENLALPKYTSPIVNKFLKPLCSAYNELVTAYQGNNSAELRGVVTKYQELLTGDNNMGLVQQVVASQTRTNIRRLTRTFITLSLADLASRVGLSTPQEVEREIVGMIEEGSDRKSVV